MVAEVEGGHAASAEQLKLRMLRNASGRGKRPGTLCRNRCAALLLLRVHGETAGNV